VIAAAAHQVGEGEAIAALPRTRSGDDLRHPNEAVSRPKTEGAPKRERRRAHAAAPDEKAGFFQ